MKKNRVTGEIKAFFLILTLLSLTIVSCKEDKDDLVKPKTVTDVLLENQQFSIIREIVQAAQMSDAFRSANFTFFIPDNNAFGRANISSASAITSRSDSAARLFIQNHIIEGQLEYQNLTPGVKRSLNKKELRITKVDSTAFINGCEILKRNVNADNAIIHVIDSVLVRPL
jgi:uncharacterized surface protein with fasciclin (FAS1) repeats